MRRENREKTGKDTEVTGTRNTGTDNKEKSERIAKSVDKSFCVYAIVM